MLDLFHLVLHLAHTVTRHGSDPEYRNYVAHHDAQ